MAAELMLPPPGRWALGPDAQAEAEALVLAAQRAGLRTGWLAAEAGFLSNLNIEENLRLLHDWQPAPGESFEGALARAEAALDLDAADFLHARPAHLRAAVLLRARLLRLALLRPGLVVLAPALLAQANHFAPALLEALAGARLLLLGEAAGEWPAWPPVANVGEASAVSAGAAAASAAAASVTTAPATAAPAAAVPGGAIAAEAAPTKGAGLAAEAAPTGAAAPSPDVQDPPA